MNPKRRPLQFEDFDAITADVERLLAGHETVGAWTLGQICDHLATVTRALVDRPATPRPDPALRLPEDQKREIFATGRLPEGLPMPATLATPDAVPADEGAARLRAALEYYRASPTGPVAEHRLFGPLGKAEWDRLVRIHSAHHLSFAVPAAG